MASTIGTPGSITSSASEQTVIEYTGSKYVSGYIDATNMQSGDTAVIKTYLKVASAGSYVIMKTTTLTGAQTEPLKYLAPLPSDIAYKVTIQRTAGTDRAYTHRFYGV